MNANEVVAALGSLAQPARLAIFRALVEAGPKGLNAGQIGTAAGLAPSSVSFHMKELGRGGLVTSRQQGRFVFYTANYASMDALLGYLTENCCRGTSRPGKRRHIGTPTQARSS